MKYRVHIEDFYLTDDEYLGFQDNELSLHEILDNRFSNDQLHIYVIESNE
jgi:hypothetical protein